MPLEALLFPQGQLNYYTNKDISNLLGGGNWSSGFGLAEKEEDQTKDHQHQSFGFLENYQTESSSCCQFQYGNWINDHLHVPPSSQHFQQWDHPLSSLDQYSNNTTDDSTVLDDQFQSVDINNASPAAAVSQSSAAARPRRRRSKGKKNLEEIENQRMTHIAVERNRRKQMNEYLAVLRALMPECYVQRGDQASIVGGAINYVKELEQQLQFLGGQKNSFDESSSSSSLPFAEFFTFPQYSTVPVAATCCDVVGNYSSSSPIVAAAMNTNHQNESSIADIEVTMVDSHANLKIRSKRRPKQLLKMVSALQSLRLTILHLNVSTAHHIVLYSLSVKVEDDCRLTSVDEIATAVYQLLGRIQEEAVLS